MTRLRTVRGYLEAKILTILLILLLCGFGASYYLISEKVEKNFISQVREKSEMLADTIHHSIDLSMVRFKADIIRHFMQDMKGVEGLARIQIIRGKTGNGTEEAFQDFITLEDVKKRVPGGLRPEWIENHANKERNVAEGVDTPEFKAAFEQYAQDPEKSPIYYFEEIHGKRVMTYLKPLPNFNRCFLCHDSDHKLRGVLMISTSMEETVASIKEQKKNLLTISTGTLLITGFLLKVSMSGLIVGPIKKVSERIQDIAEGEGDLSKRLDARSNDEIGRLAKGFNLFAEKLSNLISHILTAATKVSTTSADVMARSKEIVGGAEIQIKATEATSVSITQMNSSIKSVAETSEGLAITSKESANTIQQMTIVMDEIARNTNILTTSVEETSSSMLSMSSSVKNIDENVEKLLRESEVTTSSMLQMDQSLKKMRSNMLETVDLSQEVIVDADSGKKTVEMTMDGMSRIKEYSLEVFQIVRNLQKQTENIGKFLNVIDEVAEQTNLLALNAAIIAAQAGEHGKGFSVVSNEIKELAERTASSTHEIHAIIKALQAEGKRAVEAIEVGNSRVEEGVLLSKSAHDALGKIVESVNHSTQQTILAANMVEEQSKGIKQVTTSMDRVNQMVHQIAKATNEQGKGSEQIIEATQKMKSITQDLQEVIQLHLREMRKMKGTVEEVSHQTQEIADRTADQRIQSEEIIHAIEQIKKVTNENVDTVGRVGFAVEELLNQAKRLEADISRFKL